MLEMRSGSKLIAKGILNLSSLLMLLALTACDTLGTTTLYVENRSRIPIVCFVRGGGEPPEGNKVSVKDRKVTIAPGERSEVFSVTHMGDGPLYPSQMEKILIQNFTIEKEDGSILISEDPISNDGWRLIPKEGAQQSWSQFLLVFEDKPGIDKWEIDFLNTLAVEVWLMAIERNEYHQRAPSDLIVNETNGNVYREEEIA